MGDGVAMGQHILHNAPEYSASCAPCEDIQAGLVLVADARIDNRSELLQALGPWGANTDAITDSHLLLGSYQRWGEACVQRLRGSFAFAIWDSVRRRLLLARDHMGDKPIYYHASDRELLFASTAAAVAATPGHHFPLNEQRLADALVGYLEGIDDKISWYRNVFRLPPGSSLVFEQGKCTLNRYWQPTLATPIVYPREEDYLEAVTELLEKAVTARLRSPNPVGVMLSGGVDSSLLLGVARGLNGITPGLRSYSAINPADGNCRESKFISLMTTNDPHATLITAEDAEAAIADIQAWSLRLEDCFDLQMIIPALVYRAAAKDGVSAVIDGADGDVLAGLCQNHLPWLLRSGQWATAWEEAQAWAETGEGRECPLRLLLGSVKTALVPEWLRRQRFGAQITNLTRQAQRETAITAEFAGQVDLEGRIRRFYENNSSHPCDSPGLQHQSALRWPALSAGGERYERTAAAWGIEARQPLLDVQLVEFFLNIPWRLKSRPGWAKYLLRQAAAQVVPEEIAWQRGREHLGGVFHDIKDRAQLRSTTVNGSRETGAAAAGRYVKEPLSPRELSVLDWARSRTDVSGG